MAPRKKHDPIFIVLLVVVSALFIFTVIATIYLQTSGYPGNDGPFFPGNHTVINELTPAKWTYAVWLLICVWQSAWMVYVIICIFRRNGDGPVYINPPVLSYMFFITYAVGQLLLFGLFFVETTGHPVWSLVCRLGLQITLCLVMISYYVRIKEYCKCIRYKHRFDLILLRVLVQNGIALYASWCTVLTLIGFTTVMVTSANMTHEATASFSLFIFSLELIIFFIFDVGVFDRYTRYTFTTYPTVIWALVGILAQNFERERKHMVIAVALLTILATMFVIKLIVAIRRRSSDPLDFDTPKKRIIPAL